MLDSFLTTTESTIDLNGVLICMLISMVLGFVVAFTHKFTTKTSKNFLITLTLLPLITQCVILLINNNLGMSIAIAGTFSLVRFRSIPGSSRDILMVFFHKNHLLEKLHHLKSLMKKKALLIRTTNLLNQVYL